jgi:hypothetical protein
MMKLSTLPPDIAGYQADRTANRQRQHDRDKHDLQRDPRSVDQAGEDIAADLVGPQQMGPGGWGDHRVIVDLGRIIGGKPRRERGAENDQPDDDESAHANPMAGEATREYEETAVGFFRDGRISTFWPQSLILRSSVA